MSHASSWREFLKELISIPTQRDRLANELGVRHITLTRWASGESNPRPKHIRQLLQVLPKEQYTQFYALLEQDKFPLLEASADSSSSELPYDFIMQVHDIYATTPDSLRSWTIYRLILQHALRQLDPERLGMSITIVQCMPPAHDGRIHSLREITGQGTPPWEGNLEEKSIFLGAESLAGYAVTVFHPEAVQDLKTETTLIPAYQTEYEISAIASPILFANRIAGCLLISSTQTNYFLSQARLSQINGYARLIALAFEPKEFYPPEIIQLNVMPSTSVQRQLFKTFRQRVHIIMRKAFEKEQTLSVKDAEQMAWQQLEDDLSNPPYPHPL